MRGVAKEDFVAMDAEPFCTQPPCDVTANGRGEHGDDNQIETGANLECVGRYARTAPWRHGREAHASAEREEDERQRGSGYCTRHNRRPRYRRAIVDRGGKLNGFDCFKNHRWSLGWMPLLGDW